MWICERRATVSNSTSMRMDSATQGLGCLFVVLGTVFSIHLVLEELYPPAPPHATDPVSIVASASPIRRGSTQYLPALMTFEDVLSVDECNGQGGCRERFFVLLWFRNPNAQPHAPQPFLNVSTHLYAQRKPICSSQTALEQCLREQYGIQRGRPVLGFYSEQSSSDILIERQSLYFNDHSFIHHFLYVSLVSSILCVPCCAYFAVSHLLTAFGSRSSLVPRLTALEKLKCVVVKQSENEDKIGKVV